MLISPSYLDEQRALHAAPRGYGGSGHKWAPAVIEFARSCGALTVLDYGCGQGTLRKVLLGFFRNVYEYDPAIEGKRDAVAADLVVCTDVLEHVESDCIGAVLDHIRSLTKIAALVGIAQRPAGKQLSDGRDAHITLRPPEWWTAQFTSHGFSVKPRTARRGGEWAAVLR